MAALIGIPKLGIRQGTLVQGKAYINAIIAPKMYNILKQLNHKYLFQPVMTQNEASNVVAISTIEIVHNIKQDQNLYSEKLGKQEFVRFYFDLDYKFKTKAAAEAVLEDKGTYEDKVYEHLVMVFKDYVKKYLVKDQCQFIWRSGGPKRMTSAANPDLPPTWKISAHITIQGYKVKYQQLGQLIKLLNKPFGKDWEPLYDTKAYGNTQNFQCVFCRKNAGKVEGSRILYPNPILDNTAWNFQKFLVQNVFDCKEVDLNFALLQLRSELPSEKSLVQVNKSVAPVADFDAEEVSQLMQMLPAVVAEDFDLSLRVQYTCKTLGDQQGDIYKYLPDFVQYIMQKDMFKDMDYDQVFSFVKTNWYDKLPSNTIFTIGYLKHLVQIYAPQKYQQVYKVQQFTRYDAVSIRNHLQSVFNNKIVYSNKQWFQFNQDRKLWEEQDRRPTIIKRYIEEVLHSYFMEKSNIYKELLENPSGQTTPEKNAQFSDQAEFMQRLATMCRSPAKRDNIIGDLQDELFDTKFVSLLDSKVDLLNFNNGVVQFKSDGWVFRERKPTDFVQQTCGYDFVLQVGDYEQKIQRIRQVMLDSLEDKQVLEFLLDCIVYALHGDKYDEIFLSFVGTTGRNGKGIINGFISDTLGDYAGSINIQLFIGSSNGNQASDQMLQLKSKRWITSTEPRPNQKINSERIKKIRGNDIMEERKLYGDTQYFKTQSLLVFQSNDVLNLDNPDRAIISTKYDIRFNVEFVKSEEEIKTEQHKLGDAKVKQLFTNDISYCQAFILFLLDRYYEKRFHEKQPIYVPQVVKENNRDALDMLIQQVKGFVDRVCIVDQDPNSYISSAQLYKDFVRITQSKMCESEFCKKVYQIQVLYKQAKYLDKTSEGKVDKNKKTNCVVGLRMKEEANKLGDMEKFMLNYVIRDKSYYDAPIRFNSLFKSYIDFLNDTSDNFISMDMFKTLLGDECRFGGTGTLKKIYGQEKTNLMYHVFYEKPQYVASTSGLQKLGQETVQKPDLDDLDIEVSKVLGKRTVKR